MSQNYNLEEIKKLIDRARGTRTMRDYAAQCGMSQTAMSLIATGKRKINMNQILMLTSNEAKPLGGVTAELLAEAAGFISLSASHMEDAVFANVTSEDAPIADRFNHQRELEIITQGVIQQLFIDKNIKSSAISVISDYYHPTVAYEIGDGKEWWFEMNTFVGHDEKMAEAKIQQILSKILLVKPDSSRKLSIVMDIEDYFDDFIKYAGNLAYKGDLSIAYLNREKMRIEKEMYLSYFDDKKIQELDLI